MTSNAAKRALAKGLSLSLLMLAPSCSHLSLRPVEQAFQRPDPAPPLQIPPACLSRAEPVGGPAPRESYPDPGKFPPVANLAAQVQWWTKRAALAQALADDWRLYGTQVRGKHNALVVEKNACAAGLALQAPPAQ